MYTLLQVYHLGTNRLVFYLTPRPHTVEPPTGLSGPRNLDGVQDLFLVVNQAKDDELPCITVRLDTGHLLIQPVYDFDTSQSPQTLTATADAPAPSEEDSGASRTPVGESQFYDCFFKSVVGRNSLTAPSGYVIALVEDVENVVAGPSSFQNDSVVTLSPDGRQLDIVATATGTACHRNNEGDIANHAVVGPLDFAGLDVWAETSSAVAGSVRRTVRASFRSETPTKKVGDEQFLVLTTRQLRCCDARSGAPTVDSVGPKVVDIAPADHSSSGLLPTSSADNTRPSLAAVGDAGAGSRAPGTARSPATGIGLAAANAMQRSLAETTQRLAMRLRDAEKAPARDRELLIRSVVTSALEDRRQRRVLVRKAKSLGLTRAQLKEMAVALGRPGAALTRLDILRVPDSLIESITGRKGAALIRLRLTAAGIPVKTTGRSRKSSQAVAANSAISSSIANVRWTTLMSGEIELPHPTEFIGYEDGGYVLYKHDADGNLISKNAISLVEALRFLNQLIALHGTNNVPWRERGGAVKDATATNAELQTELLAVLDEIWRTLPGDETARADALADIVRTTVTQPEAIRLLTEVGGISPSFWRQVWPDLEQRLSSRPEGVPLGDAVPIGVEETGHSQAIEGAGRTGPGGQGGAAQAVPPVLPAGTAIPSGPTGASGGAVTDAARASDPVLPFSGQLLVEATDLELDGIGIDFVFHRTYLHGTRYFGPLGPQWDHSYNLWLRETIEPTPVGGREHVVYQSTGSLRTEQFHAALGGAATSPADITDAQFTGPDGVFDLLVKRGSRFISTAPNGVEIHYNDQLRAEILRDRVGNELRLSYRGDPPQLAEIVDTCRRRIQFEYDAEGRLCHIRDTSLDRHLWFAYDESGRLTSVRRSVDAQASIVTAAYRYWGYDAPPGLDANILALIDGRGIEVLQVHYGIEPGLISYNRVLEQRNGGVTRFDYEFIAEIDEADRANAAVLRVRMTLPTNDVQVLDYNEQGRLVRLQLDDRNPLAPRRLTSRWRYNADGNLVREERPDGSVIAYSWGREMFGALRDPSEASPGEWTRFGQLRRAVEYRRPGARGPFTRITEIRL